VISEHRPTTVVKILETAFFNNGANLRKLIDKSRLTEYPEKMKLYLLILENRWKIPFPIVASLLGFTPCIFFDS
jgi:hypothetical protein